MSTPVPRVVVPLAPLRQQQPPTPEQALVANWKRFHDDLDSLSLDHVVNLIETGPKELVHYIHFVMGGSL